MASSYAPNQWAKMRPKDIILDKMRNLSRCRVCYAEITQIFRTLGVKRPKSCQQRIALEFIWKLADRCIGVTAKGSHSIAPLGRRLDLIYPP